MGQSIARLQPLTREDEVEDKLKMLWRKRKKHQKKKKQSIKHSMQHTKLNKTE